MTNAGKAVDSYQIISFLSVMTSAVCLAQLHGYRNVLVCVYLFVVYLKTISQ